MSVKSAPYYWLECDEPGCTAKSTEHSDFAAWADAGQAADEARDGDWTVDVGPELLDYCEEHARYVCEEPSCETVITREQWLDGEVCSVHAQEVPA